MLKSDIKIILISFYNDEAYGLRLIHSVLSKAGYNTKMLFVKLNSLAVNRDDINSLSDKELDLIKDYIKKEKPNLVAYSLVSSNFSIFKKVQTAIKPLGHFLTLVGGWQASLNPEETIQHCDFLCRGEGEEAIVELIDNLFNKYPIYNIKNLWLRSDVFIRKSSVRPLIKDLNKFPTVILNNSETFYIENGNLIKKDPYLENERYGTLLSRGCPFACTYCSNSFMSGKLYDKKWSKIRFRNTEHIMKELLDVKQYLPNIKRINFYDEVFQSNNEWKEKLFSEYKEKIKLPFYCMFYPGTCDRDTARLLKESGLAGVWVGIQSGSERVRKEVFKRFYTNETILKQAEIFKEFDISVKYDFILDNPFETKEEFIETLDLMKALPKPCGFNFFSLKYFPNTEITRMALDKGIITEKDLNDNLKTDHQNYTISKNRIKDLEKIIYE